MLRTKLLDFLRSTSEKFPDNRLLLVLKQWSDAGKSERWEDHLKWPVSMVMLLSTSEKFENKTAIGTVTLSDIGNNALKNPISKNQIKDLRPLCISISGIKTYPISKCSNQGYGLYFCDSSKQITKECEPLSSIYIGANGVGKTSLFVAMELWGMGTSMVAYGHNFKTRNEQRLVNRNESGKVEDVAETPKISVLTRNGIFNYDDSIEFGLGLPASFFLSEYDFFFLEQNNFNTEYLCEQLGLTSFYHLYKFLVELERLNGEANDIFNPSRTITNEVSRNPKADENTKIKRGIEFKSKYNIKASTFKKSKLQLKDLDQCIELLHKFINDAINRFYDISTKYIPSLLSKHSEENEQFIVSLYKSSTTRELDEVSIQLRLGETPTRTPREIYNTFRFKLYVVCLKISIAICAQRIHRILFPVVIDDIFDASDFNNRNNIHLIIGNLLYNYEHYIPKSNKYPLQLIVFSQDELIANGFHKAIKCEYGIAKVKYSRLHYFKDIIDSTEESPNDKNHDGVKSSDNDIIDLDDCTISFDDNGEKHFVLLVETKIF